jgi:exonuclease III
VPNDVSSHCMRFLAWNCRGLSHASTIHSLRNKIRIHSPDILFLFETKTQTSNVVVILNRLGFYLMVHAPPFSFKGRLLLTWRHDVDLKCILTFVNTINVWCYSDPLNSPWLLSCIYGCSDQNY